MGNVAAWIGDPVSGRKLAPGYVFAPTTRAGGSPYVPGPADPIGLAVELNLGALGWVDVSPYALYRDSSAFITISRGRPNETSSITPQTATFQLNNSDGRFSPRNPNGPYYGNIGRNTQVRISRMQNGVRRYRFCGEVVSWPTTWDQSGTDVWIPVQAAGMLRRLQQGTQTLGSAMYRAYALQEAASLNAVAYWPCEDGATSTSFASGVKGVGAMSFTGTPTLASNSAFLCSLPLPVLNSSTWRGRVPTIGTWTDNVCRFLVQIPTNGDTNNGVLASMYTNGTVKRVDLIYGSGAGSNGGAGLLTVTGFDSSGAQLFTIGPFSDLNGNGFNGQLLRASFALRTSGANVEYEWQTIAVAGGISAASGTLNAASIGPVASVVVNTNGNLVGTAIGHVSVQAVWDSLADLVSQLNAWYNEGSPGSRISRLCGEQGVNEIGFFVLGNAIGGDGVTLGYQTSDTLANLLQQCVDTDNSMLFESREQLALIHRNRVYLYNQGTSYNPQRGLTLDYAQAQLSGPLDPLDDDANTRNDVTVTAITGSFAQAAATTGSMSTQPPPNGVGDYATTYSLSLGNLATSLPDHAHWRLRLGTVDEPRYPNIHLNLRSTEITGSVDLMNQALVMDIGDLVIINNPPAWMPPDQIRQILQGYTETLGVFEHDMVLNCSPEAPYRVGVVGDTVLSTADTDGSTIVADNGGTLTVASTNPLLPPWTTNAGAFPFDIALSPLGVGGERVTVTNITGASSPQTFTVTRSVNGIAKTWPPGTDVRLWQATYVSL